MKIIYIMYNFYFLLQLWQITTLSECSLHTVGRTVCLLCHKGNIVFVSGQGCEGTYDIFF